MEGKGVFDSPQGDVSSRRIAGYVLAPLGVVAMVYGGVTGNELLVRVGQSFLYTGGILLGLGTLDHLK